MNTFKKETKMNFKQYLTEASLGKHWSRMGGEPFYTYELNDKNIESAMGSLLRNEFGMSKGAGTGSASSAAMVRPNKKMTFNYGFSEATMGSYVNLNGKPVTVKTLTKAIKDIGPSIEGELFIIKFGKGYLTYNDMQEDSIQYYDNASRLKDDLIEFNSMYEDDMGEVQDRVDEIMKTLSKM